MALFVFLAATTRALFVAPHLTTLGCAIKLALRRRLRHTIGTSAGRFMAFIPVSAFLSYDHGSSQDSVLRLGELENILEYLATTPHNPASGGSIA